MMRANAVLGKELTTRMRGGRSAAVITAYLVLLGGVALIILSSSTNITNAGSAANLGNLLFGFLAGIQMVLIIFITPATTADAISGERQRQTLDLLLVTRLSSFRIILGKLIAGVAFNVLLILSSLPLFSLVFLFGGVSPDQFVAMFIIFLTATLVLGSMSIFISTMLRRTGAAAAISVFCTLGLTLGIGLFGIWFAAVTASTASGTSAAIPFFVYVDPGLGFVAALPGAWQTMNSVPHFTLGAINLAIWQDQVIADIILSALFVLGSVRMLRPHWRPS